MHAYIRRGYYFAPPPLPTSDNKACDIVISYLIFTHCKTRLILAPIFLWHSTFIYILFELQIIWEQSIPCLNEAAKRGWRLNTHVTAHGSTQREGGVRLASTSPVHIGDKFNINTIWFYWMINTGNKVGWAGTAMIKCEPEHARIHYDVSYDSAYIQTCKLGHITTGIRVKMICIPLPSLSLSLIIIIIDLLKYPGASYKLNI